MQTSTVRQPAMAPASSVSWRPHAPAEREPIPLSQHYLAIPTRLLNDLRDTPLAVGIWLLIARLYVVQDEPVALSRGDLRKIDPTLKVGSIKRACERLVEAGWLSVDTSHIKNTYTPTWGRSRTGRLYHWHVGQRLLGCPESVWKHTVRVPASLIDIFVGKVIAHHRMPARLESYFVRDGKPVGLLGLSDIGAYALAMDGVASIETEALRAWGLLDGDTAQPIPLEATILAIASQRATIATFQLTSAAWRRLGVVDAGEQPPDQASSGQVLLFVPQERIGSLIGQQIGDPIGHWIGCERQNEGRFTAPETSKLAQAGNTSKTTWNPMDSKDSKDSTTRSGGSSLSEDVLETETTRLLKDYGVFSRQALQELAHLPVYTVQDILTYARQEGLGPGWVVTYLSEYRNSDVIVIPTRKTQGNVPVDWGAVARQNASGMARLGSDVSDLAGFGAIEEALSSVAAMLRENASEVQSASQLHQDLVAEMKQHLRMQCERRYYAVIDELQFSFEPTRTVVRCRSERECQLVERLRLMLRSAARLVGVSTNIVLVCN